VLKVLAGTGVCSASSAAQSIRLRRGVGKLRELHLQFCHLGSDGRDARRCFNHGRRLVFNLKWRLGDTRRYDRIRVHPSWSRGQAKLQWMRSRGGCLPGRAGVTGVTGAGGSAGGSADAAAAAAAAAASSREVHAANFASWRPPRGPHNCPTPTHSPARRWGARRAGVRTSAGPGGTGARVPQRPATVAAVIDGLWLPQTLRLTADTSIQGIRYGCCTASHTRYGSTAIRASHTIRPHEAAACMAAA
jgi:hypothetical protein